MRRTEWVWVAVLIVLLLLTYGLVPRPRDEEGVDSYSISYRGKKAFFQLSESLLPDVGRNTDSLLPPDDADTLVILGPAKYPDRVEWQMLYDWVSEGHALVFAARWSDPEVELGVFDVEVKLGYSATEDTESEQVEAELEVEQEEPEPWTPESELFTELAEGELEWRSFARVEFASAEAEVVVMYHDSAQVIQQPVGEGLLIVAGSDYIFNNVALAEGDNGVLAFRILELAYPTGPVYFDESLNAAGPPKIVGILFDEPLRPLTLQFIIFSVLFIWMGSRRFGPAAVARAARRRSLTEHAAALGNLHYKVGSGRRVVASYLEYFRQELKLHHEKSREAQAIAERARIDLASVKNVLTQADRATKNPNLEPAKAAWLVKSLAKLKEKAERLKGANNGA
jgi:hypothetical protein